MADTRKKRLSMLDTLAASGAGQASAPMMATNRALRSARDAVDSHRVWDLDPADVIDLRTRDRLDPSDVIDLRDAIDTNGQTVPILVRRHPEQDGKYLLVYGRRRLEAIRQSEKVTKVRALVASLDDRAAVTAQISENMARRDLSFIEKAFFAKELVETGFGNQSQVAEVLTVTKSSVSMALSVAETVGAELAEAIGPAHGIGRPRWEAFARALEASRIHPQDLIPVVDKVYTDAETAMMTGGTPPEDTSVAAFEAAMARLAPAPAKSARKAPADPGQTLMLEGRRAGRVKRTPKGLALDIQDAAFADWLEAEAQDVLSELHARWKNRAED